MTSGDVKSQNGPPPGAYKVPSPQPNGEWLPPPPLKADWEDDVEDDEEDVADSMHPPASVPAGDVSVLSRVELEARLAAAEARLARYDAASRALAAALALAPSANAAYAQVARRSIVAALRSLPAVVDVLHCECSFPALASGAEDPLLRLARFDGLHFSQWQVDWRPASWWLSVALITTLGMRVTVRVSQIRVKGVVRVAAAPDLSSIRIAFAGSPRIELGIETQVSVGSVPIPLRETIDSGIRNVVMAFVQDNLIHGNSMLFVLRRKPLELTDDDLAAAAEAAVRHASIASV